MNLSPEAFAALVSRANLAPSVHNTQPTRWRLAPDASVLVFEDTTRRLAVGDACGRDAQVSHGAAIEGFALAAGGQFDVAVETLEGAPQGHLRPVARLTLCPGGGGDALADVLARRRTYRGVFTPAPRHAGLDGLAAVDDICLVEAPEGIAHVAALNDQASLRNFRDPAFRAELLSWMRLSRRDPRWAVDGLNAAAMEMSGFEAMAAGVVLRPGVFESLDRVGMAAPVVGEAKVVRSAMAIALFHRPDGEGALETGRRYHRFWLELAALGLSAAPMAVLADDPEAQAVIRSSFGVPLGRRLITAFRVGVSPRPEGGPRPRLKLERLLV